MVQDPEVDGDDKNQLLVMSARWTEIDLGNRDAVFYVLDKWSLFIYLSVF